MMRVILDLKGGGVFDGTLICEKLPEDDEVPFEFDSVEAGLVYMAYASTKKGAIGEQFLMLSPGRMTCTAVFRDNIFPCYRYEIIDRLDSDDEILLQCKFIGNGRAIGTTNRQMPNDDSRPEES